jgi:hypothetical protein
MMIRPWCLSLPLLLATGAALAETPTLLLFRQTTPVQLLVYDSDDCDEASVVECTSLALQCASIGALTVTVYGLYREEISKWVADGGKLNIAGIPGLSTLDIDQSSASDADGAWSVSFRAGYERPNVLDDEAFGPALAFDTIYGKVSVALNTASTQIVRAFLAGCGDSPSRSG